MLHRSAPLLALAAVLALAVTGCSSAERPVATPSAPPVTPIARLNTAAMRLPRIDFCSLIPRASVAAAVGTKDYRATAYGDGDSTQVTPTVRDVVHEIGCTGTDGTTTARAWLFGSPVTTATARAVQRQARHQAGCHLSSGPAFGDPSLEQVCRDGDDRRVRYAGLFGDTWLTCEIEGRLPLPTMEDRAGTWCVDVATVLNTTR